MKRAIVVERPDLVEPGWKRTRDTLPEYNDHGDVLNVYWGRLTEERTRSIILSTDPTPRPSTQVRLGAPRA